MIQWWFDTMAIQIKMIQNWYDVIRYSENDLTFTLNAKIYVINITMFYIFSKV